MKKFYKYLITGFCLVGLAFFAGYLFINVGAGFVKAFATPPPASNLFLIEPGPGVNKFLTSKLGEDSNRNFASASNTIGDSYPVGYGEILTIEIEFNPGSLDAGESVKPISVRESFPTRGGEHFFTFQSVDCDDCQVAPSLSPDDPVRENNLMLNLSNSSLSQNDTLKIILKVRAVKYTNSNPVTIEKGAKFSYENKDGNVEKLDVPDAEIEVRDYFSPIGDIYSLERIDNEIAQEPEPIDLAAVKAGNLSDHPLYFGSRILDRENDHKKSLVGYGLVTNGHEFGVEFEKIKEGIISRLENEIAVKCDNLGSLRTKLQANNGNQPSVIHYRGDLTNNSPISVTGKKVVIIDGNFNISRNITYSNNQLDQVAFIVKGDRVRIQSRVDQVNGFFFLSLDDGSAGSFEIANRAGDTLRINGTLIVKKLEIAGDNPVSYKYDPRGLSGLPGIEKLMSPSLHQVAP